MRRNGAAGEAGTTLVETLAALVLLGLALLMAAAVVSWGHRLEARTVRRAVALDVAQGLVESLRATPYPAVKTAEIALGPLTKSVLPEGQAALAVDEDEALGVKRVRVVVSWKGADPGRVVLATALGRRQVYR